MVDTRLSAIFLQVSERGPRHWPPPALLVRHDASARAQVARSRVYRGGQKTDPFLNCVGYRDGGRLTTRGLSGHHERCRFRHAPSAGNALAPPPRRRSPVSRHQRRLLRSSGDSRACTGAAPGTSARADTLNKNDKLVQPSGACPGKVVTHAAAESHYCLSECPRFQCVQQRTPLRVSGSCSRVRSAGCTLMSGHSWTRRQLWTHTAAVVHSSQARQVSRD